MNYYEPLTYIVPREEADWTLKAILQRRMRISRRLLSRLKSTDRGITVNGVRSYISVSVRPGDRVEVRMAEERSEDILPEPIPFDILFEDEHLLIVNKSAGMVVHPTHGHYVHTLANAVVHHWMQRGESCRFRPVHRLDRETSGALLIAKNPYAHQQLFEQMKSGQVEKWYLAVVDGHPPQDRGTVEAPIDRDPLHPHLRIAAPDGYPAVTHYFTERTFARHALLRLRLETGRTHQIRVHLRHIGCPIVADKLYGLQSSPTPANGEPAAWPDAADSGMERQALHAVELEFTHFMTGERMRVHAPLPADFQRLLNVVERSKIEWEN